MYANEWVDDVTVSQMSMYFVHRNDENPIFQPWDSKPCLISTLNKCRIMFALICCYMGTCFYIFQPKNWNFQIYKIHGKLWGDEIINWLICIFMSTVQEILKILIIKNFLFSLFFCLIYNSYFHFPIIFFFFFLLLLNWYRLDVWNWNCIVVISWPAWPSCAQNQLRTVLNDFTTLVHATMVSPFTIDFKDGHQLILCATWPRRPAGTTIAFQLSTSKWFWYLFYMPNWNVIVVPRWPARISCAQNQLRTVLNCHYAYINCIISSTSLVIFIYLCYNFVSVISCHVDFNVLWPLFR